MRGPKSNSSTTASATAIRIRLRRVSFGIRAAGRIPTRQLQSWVLKRLPMTCPNSTHLPRVIFSATGRFATGGKSVQRVDRMAQRVDLDQLQAVFVGCLGLVTV